MAALYCYFTNSTLPIHIFRFLSPLSQGSVRQTRYVFGVDECMKRYSFQMRWHRITVSMLCLTDRDAFDTLFDHAPDKLNVVKKVCRLRSGGLSYILAVLECRFVVALLFLIDLFLNRH